MGFPLRVRKLGRVIVKFSNCPTKAKLLNERGLGRDEVPVLCVLYFSPRYFFNATTENQERNGLQAGFSDSPYRHFWSSRSWLSPPASTYNYHCIINFFNLPLSFICTHLIWVHPQEPVVEILKCDYLKSFLW